MDHYDAGLIDPRDIGTAVLAALSLPYCAWKPFNSARMIPGWI